MRQALNNAQATQAGFGFISTENVFKVALPKAAPTLTPTLTLTLTLTLTQTLTLILTSLKSVLPKTPAWSPDVTRCPSSQT